MKVVVSYRREDSQDIAERIGDHLAGHFASRNVFIDTGSIAGGKDFRAEFLAALHPRAVLVAVVGKDWRGPREGATPRINDDNDEVRFEIAHALKTGVRIIPVLVNGATMPVAGELPSELKAFAKINALEVERGPNFSFQMAAVIRTIEPGLPRKVSFAIMAALVVALALGLAWIVNSGRVTFSTVAPVGDVEVATFRVPEGRPELNFIRYKIERNFVDLFSDAKLRVRSPLTTNQSLQRNHYTLHGEIAERPEWAGVSAELKNADGFVVGASKIEGRLDELEALYKVIPEALMFGMGVDPPTLKKVRPAARLTDSIEAYAHFLEARRRANLRDFDGAERHLRRSIALDDTFATAFWAIGEIYRLRGDTARAKEWHDEAERRGTRGRGPEYSRPSIQPAFESRPVPAILSQSKATKASELLSGAAYAAVMVPAYAITLHVWTFDQKRFQLKVVQQSRPDGDDVEALLRGPGDVFAVNGGFFDIDAGSRLSPSGLLVVDRATIRNVSTSGGSGVVFATDSAVGIVPRAGFRSEGVRSAVQSGPLVVDPGGKLGIYREDFDRQRRSAVCLDGGAVKFVLVEGGMSLFELGQVLSAPRDSGGLACEVALNLDGGPSAQALFKGGGHVVSVVGRWRIQNALVMTIRE